jgi:hypothetical protein
MNGKPHHHHHGKLPLSHGSEATPARIRDMGVIPAQTLLLGPVRELTLDTRALNEPATGSDPLLAPASSTTRYRTTPVPHHASATSSPAVVPLKKPSALPTRRATTSPNRSPEMLPHCGLKRCWHVNPACPPTWKPVCSRVPRCQSTTCSETKSGTRYAKASGMLWNVPAHNHRGREQQEGPR